MSNIASKKGIKKLSQLPDVLIHLGDAFAAAKADDNKITVSDLLSLEVGQALFTTVKEGLAFDHSEALKELKDLDHAEAVELCKLFCESYLEFYRKIAK